MRFVSLSKAFDSKAKVRLLEFLLGNYTQMGGREMARVVGLSAASVSRIMREFQELDLVQPQRFGNVIVWNLNKESLAYRELKKMADLPAPLEHLIKFLRTELADWGVKKAVLFGSVARGEERPGSDIDLFLRVPNGADLEEKLTELNEKCLKLYGNPLKAYVLTEKEFKHPPNPNLVKEIEKGTTILQAGNRG